MDALLNAVGYSDFQFEFCLNARMKDFYHLFQKICCPATVRFLKFTVPWLEQLVAQQEGKSSMMIMIVIMISFLSNLLPRWWFQIFFIFIPIWGNDPI